VCAAAGASKGMSRLMNRSIALSHIALALALLAGCSSYRPAPAGFHQALNQPYQLGAGDRVRVTVFEQESLTNTYSIDQSGYLAFPLIGSIPARGRSAQQIEVEIADKLRQGYVRDPDVSVEVDRYRPIFVMGEVGAAGQYSYVPGLTVQKAVAMAGGFSPRAAQENVDITRDINGKVMTGRVVTSDPLLPGDTVYVRERLF
jgi:polysaccharide export outer membrane protein